MFPLLQLGPFAIQTPGLILILGLWLGLSFSERFLKRYQISSDQLYNLVFIMLIAGILSARFVYVARFPSAFSANLRSLISLNPGLLDPFGGLAFALIAAMIFIQKQKLPFWPLFDAYVPLLLILNTALPLANMASGSGFGTPTDIPWAIELWGADRHPSQVYELISGLIILAVLFPTRKWIHRLSPGIFFLIFLSSSSFARLLLDAFRGDSIVLANGIRVPQLISWLLLACALFGIAKLRTTHQKI